MKDNAFERWWEEVGCYLYVPKSDLAKRAWAAGIDWWSEQLNEPVRMPPKLAGKEQENKGQEK